MALGNAERIGALSLRYKIPVVSPFREITDAGGLLSYGPDLSMLFRRSASLVDQILKGAKPGDLPIGQPNDSSSAPTCKRRNPGSSTQRADVTPRPYADAVGPGNNQMA